MLRNMKVWHQTEDLMKNNISFICAEILLHVEHVKKNLRPDALTIISHAIAPSLVQKLETEKLQLALLHQNRKQDCIFFMLQNASQFVSQSHTDTV